MTTPSGLDDRAHAAFAWARFRQILAAMAATGLAVALFVLAYLWWTSGPLPWLFMLVTTIGIWMTVMMAALLMGLMFLSSGTGHDHAVEDRLADEFPIDD
jgi:hypothetical protein